VQPKAVVIICGGRNLQSADGIVSEKKIKDEELNKLISGPLWEKKKE